MDAYDKTFNGSALDLVFFRINQFGNKLLQSTFVGGVESEQQPKMKLYNDDGCKFEVAVGVTTFSQNFPTTPLDVFPTR